MKKRLFVSISLPDWLVDELLLYGEDVELRGFRWTAGDNLHITVHFIGYVDDNRINDLSDKLSEAAHEFKSFSLAMDGIEFGPPGEAPRMIWAKFRDSPPYNMLAGRIADTLGEFSERSTNRPIPHVTLARFKTPSLADGVNLNRFKETEFEVSEVELMESVIFPDGPEYNVVESYKLI